MKKTYRSSSIAREFTGTRTECIQQAKNYLSERLRYDTSLRGLRVTWRADDDSGFTLTIGSITGVVSCSHRWNASRKD